MLCGGRQPQSRRGPSPYNVNWEFPYEVEGKQCQMVFTSVTGHLMEMEFEGSHKSWRGCNPRELIDGARVNKHVGGGKEPVAENLTKEARNAQWLILWLDCDREGENIAFEVIQVCLAAKRTLVVKRAQFSALSHNDVTRALRTLRPPNKHEADAVDMRQELDLRLGASFTRFNTMLLQNNVRLPGADEDGKGAIVSYGPCQFPPSGSSSSESGTSTRTSPSGFGKSCSVTRRDGRAREAAPIPAEGTTRPRSRPLRVRQV